MPSLLIDAEYYLYRCAAGAESELEWAPDVWTYVCRHDDAKEAFEEKIAEFMGPFPGYAPVLCLGARTSFRKGLWPAYKENRRKLRRPAGYGQLLAWVLQAGPSRGWESATLPEVEGDDVLGVLFDPGHVLVSEDKDMLTLPGIHFRAGERIEVSQWEADFNFYCQALVGDASDNYPGCPKIGPVTAEKLLAGCRTEGDLWAAVRAAYRKAGLDERYAITMARCARILRPGEYDHEKGLPVLWEPPVT